MRSKTYPRRVLLTIRGTGDRRRRSHAEQLVPLPAPRNPSESSCVPAPIRGSVGLFSVSSSSLGRYAPPTSLRGVSFCAGLRQGGLPEVPSHFTKHRVQPAGQAHRVHPSRPLSAPGAPGRGGPPPRVAGRWQGCGALGPRPAHRLLARQWPAGSVEEGTRGSCSGHSGNGSVLGARISPCKS